MLEIARKIEQELSKKKNIPMNIDGITAVIYAEIGCPGPSFKRAFLFVTFSWYFISYLGANAAR
jgi:citrate synthase